MHKDLWNVEIIDRKSFHEFMNLLIDDFNKNKSNWENNRLELFLEAIQAYTNDLDGYYMNNHPELDADKPTWRAFADILRGAIIYE